MHPPTPPLSGRLDAIRGGTGRNHGKVCGLYHPFGVVSRAFPVISQEKPIVYRGNTYYVMVEKCYTMGMSIAYVVHPHIFYT